MTNKKIKQLVVDAMFIALLVVSSFISIPINQIPYTLQTLVVFIILLLLPLKDSLIIFITYLIMGLIGLPVFSGFTSGITPTLGFIIGFTILPIIYKVLEQIIKLKNKNISKIINLFICLLILNVIGTIFYMFIMNLDFLSSLLICVVPFILIDVIKILASILITNRIKPILDN
jgi:biotin transport system substrate-specific component